MLAAALRGARAAATASGSFRAGDRSATGHCRAARRAATARHRPKPLAAAALLEAQAAEAKAATRRKVEPPPAPVAPPRDGTVTLAVSPWGEISVDGSSRGVSPPLTQLTLPPGVHTIEIRNGSAAPFIARVEVKSGETLGLQHRF